MLYCQIDMRMCYPLGHIAWLAPPGMLYIVLFCIQTSLFSLILNSLANSENPEFTLRLQGCDLFTMLKEPYKSRESFPYLFFTFKPYFKKLKIIVLLLNSKQIPSTSSTQSANLGIL